MDSISSTSSSSTPVPQETTNKPNVVKNVQKNEQGLSSTTEEPSNEVLKSQSLSYTQLTIPVVYQNPPSSNTDVDNKISPSDARGKGISLLPDKSINPAAQNEVFLSDDPNAKPNVEGPKK